MNGFAQIKDGQVHLRYLGWIGLNKTSDTTFSGSLEIDLL
jgi:hypothetical protein